jgi:hypothetical protein
LFQSYGATEVETMLNTLFGVESTLVISAAESGAEAADNPCLHSNAGCYLETVTPIVSTVGELSVVEATFMGGTFTRDITP